ncbi:MAG: tetratricopeptide repeat protein, partial [Candidatus Cloacimonetes bacterium]|nr:tetratricopeptide repeat protein [Candidatus Cloacimonadota bacterium]
MKGRKITRDYKDYHNIPDIYLWMAKAYFANNIPFEGRKTLDKIIAEYPDHNTRWKALELEIDLIEKDKGKKAASEELSKRLDEDISRIYEEKLRLKLAHYFINLGESEQAYLELEKLIEKFGSSANLDKYIILFSKCQLKLGKYNELINNFVEFKKVFKESSLRAEYNFYLALAYFHVKDYSKSNSIIEDILTYAENEKTIYETYLLKSHILRETGKLNEAVKSYQKLINNGYADNAELFFTIGDIYFEKFQNYSTSIKYYQRVVTGYSSQNYQQKASYKIALCYEKLEKFSDAIAELDQINLDEVIDKDFREKILHKKKYLKKFKQKDYKTAFTKLLNSFFVYLENNDKILFQGKMVNILSGDLKELEKGLNLVNNDTELKPLKAKILLRIAEKYKYEVDKENADNYIFKANSIISKLPDSNQKTELLLFKDIIVSEEVSEDLVSRIKAFINSDNTAPMRNEFILVVLNFYSNDPDYATEYFEMLQKDDNIDERDFVNSKIRLAEYYYNMCQYENALPVYELVHSKINLSTPYKLVEYAVVLNETGNQKASIEKFTLLLNNVEDLHGIGSVVFYFTKLLRNLGKFDEAIKYEQLFPSENRNDIYYNRLAGDYLQIGNKEKAKESLMYIVEKDNETLRKLAQLQFETGDLEMAKYTFEELTKKEKNNLKNYEMLGRIAFIQEDFLEASVNYEKIVEKLGDKFTIYDNISQVAKENIISLYRIENRPKAEKLTNKFKRILSAYDKNGIELSRGIYYIKIDKRKAESIFTKLLKQKNLSSNVMIEAYFWRGVVRLEMKKTKEAESDFETVANSIDENLSNQARLKLGTINFSNEKYQKALNYYYKVIENDKTGKLALDAAQNFAYVCKTIKEWQKAVAAYEIILERWGDAELEAETIFDIAFCHFRDKKYQNAIKMFERSI